MRVLRLLICSVVGLLSLGTNCSKPTRCSRGDGGAPLCERNADGTEVAVNCTGGYYEIGTLCDAGTTCRMDEVRQRASCVAE